MELVASWVPEVLVFLGFMMFVVGLLEPRNLFVSELQFLRMAQGWGAKELGGG